MAKKKTITPGHKKQKKIPQTVPETKNFATAAVFKTDKIFDYILIGLTLAYFLFYFFKLYTFLESTFFWADENVHAYISSIILKTKSLPARLPEDIYGGFEYSYPPLFHILGAIVMSIAGSPALKFTNLILLIFFLAGFYFLIRTYCGNRAALLPSLLISLSPTIAMNTIRFMTEMLSMVLVFFSFMFLAAAIKKSNLFYAIISGLATGLLMLSKQLGIVVLSFYFMLLIWFFFKHKKDVPLMLYVIGTSACIFIPYFVWAVYNGIDVFGFVSIFIGNKVEWATAAVKSFRKSESALKEFAYLFYTGNGIVISASFLIPLYHIIRTRAKDRPQNYIFLMSVYLARRYGHLAYNQIPQTHHNPVALNRFFVRLCAPSNDHQQDLGMRAAILLFAFNCRVSASKMPNYRHMSNPPTALLDLAAVIRKDYSSDGRTLADSSLRFFNVHTQAGDLAISQLEKIPVDLFAKQAPDKLYALLKQYNIDYILIDMRYVFRRR